MMKSILFVTVLEAGDLFSHYLQEVLLKVHKKAVIQRLQLISMILFCTKLTSDVLTTS